MGKLYNYICQICAVPFVSYSAQAKYCPDCRIVAQKETVRKRIGSNRRFGEIYPCEACGGYMVMTGGRQKYCEKCAPKAVAEIDKKQGLDYYQENKEKINALRYEKRKKPPKPCIVCGKAFSSQNCSLTCSDECKKKYIKAYIAKRLKGNLNSNAVCEDCGKEYTIKSGRQKRCSNCAVERKRERAKAYWQKKKG